MGNETCIASLHARKRCVNRFSELRAFQSLYGEQFPNCGTKSGTHGCNVSGAANQMVGDEGARVEN